MKRTAKDGKKKKKLFFAPQMGKTSLPRSVGRRRIDIPFLTALVVDRRKGRWVSLVELGHSVLVVIKDSFAILPGGKELEGERDRLYQGVVKLLCARHIVVAARLGFVDDLGKVLGF